MSAPYPNCPLCGETLSARTDVGRAVPVTAWCPGACTKVTGTGPTLLVAIEDFCKKAIRPENAPRPRCEMPGCNEEIPVGGEGAPEICPKCLAAEAESRQTPRKHAHYFKPTPFADADVYRVLRMFNVTDQALGHALKKLLVAGGRGGGKDISRDVQEAIDTLVRWQELEAEDARTKGGA